MAAKDNLERFEESIYHEHAQDGLSEIIMGWFLLEMALCMVLFPHQGLWQFAAFGVLWLPSIFLNRLLRRQIVYPRLGYVQVVARPRPFRFAPAFWKNYLRYLALVLLLIPFFVAAWMLPGRLHYGKKSIVKSESLWPAFEERGSFLTFIMLTILLTGQFLGMKYFWRFEIYALIIVAVGSYFQVHPGWVLCVIALPMMVIGLMRLRRFLREHPKLEAADGQ